VYRCSGLARPAPPGLVTSGEPDPGTVERLLRMPSQPDQGYQQTRAFSAAAGFRPLEELHGLWPGNPCLIMVKALRPRS
jgi:hypothetical protein